MYRKWGYFVIEYTGTNALMHCFSKLGQGFHKTNMIDAEVGWSYRCKGFIGWVDNLINGKDEGKYVMIEVRKD